MTKLPFGLKAPSKGTVVFCSVLSAVSGTIYASNYYANQARKAHCSKVSFLADRPCGVYEMPRKVTVYIMAPPGDSMEKSRAWFREYVKPILVAGAVDYEVKEGDEPGLVESSIRKEILRLRREAAAAKEREDIGQPLPVDNGTPNAVNSDKERQGNPFAPLMTDVQKRLESQKKYDGILVIGRRAWGEVLRGISKGCHDDLRVLPEEESKSEDVKEGKNQDVLKDKDDAQVLEEQEPEHTVKDELTFGNAADNAADALSLTGQHTTDQPALPPSFSPIMYIPHENIIGWTNIPYRLFRWITDYTRIDEIGKYAVAAVLNKTRPLEERDLDVGYSEKKYWIGEDAKEALDNDVPITMDEELRKNLRTYTSDDLP